MFWNTTDFHMKLFKAEWEINKQEGGEEFQFKKIRSLRDVDMEKNGKDLHDLANDAWLCSTQNGRWGQRSIKTHWKGFNNLFYNRRLLNRSECCLINCSNEGQNLCCRRHTLSEPSPSTILGTKRSTYPYHAPIIWS